MPTQIKDRTRTQIEVIALQDEHLEQAAVLFVTGYQRARCYEPLLPGCHEHPERILPKLRRMWRDGGGVAAMCDGRMAGFMLGQVLPEFRGRRTAYIPEWAHAGAGPNPREVYEAMYAEVSGRWVADGCFAHLVTLLADGRQVVDALFWFGFGLVAVDAMRELCPAPADSSGVTIRRARPDDAPAVLDLSQALQDYLAAAPILRAADEPVTAEAIAQRLADPQIRIYLAIENEQPVAYVDIGSANPSAAYIISDSRTASIKALFTKETFRRRGVGEALLHSASDWAQSNGYQRLAVDFEPQNGPGSRFWLRHFRPVCYSMVRHIEDSSR